MAKGNATSLNQILLITDVSAEVSISVEFASILKTTKTLRKFSKSVTFANYDKGLFCTRYFRKVFF